MARLLRHDSNLDLTSICQELQEHLQSLGISSPFLYLLPPTTTEILSATLTKRDVNLFQEDNGAFRLVRSSSSSLTSTPMGGGHRQVKGPQYTKITI